MKKITKTLLITSILFVGANRVKAQPINTAFNNDKLYECIIERYNKENDTTYDINHNLTDEELNNISYLTCSEEEKITDYTGIEKLTSLRKLWVSVATETLDLSHNTNLEDIMLYDATLGAVEYVSVLKNFLCFITINTYPSIILLALIYFIGS